MSAVGHNSIAGRRLRAFVERIERIEEEIKGLNADKADIYREAKANGFDIKVMKKLIQRRRLDQHERSEQDAILELYEHAIEGADEETAPRVHPQVRTHEYPADELGFLADSREG